MSKTAQEAKPEVPVFNVYAYNVDGEIERNGKTVPKKVSKPIKTSLMEAKLRLDYHKGKVKFVGNGHENGSRVLKLWTILQNNGVKVSKFQADAISGEEGTFYVSCSFIAEGSFELFK